MEIEQYTESYADDVLFGDGHYLPVVANQALKLKIQSLEKLITQGKHPNEYTIEQKNQLMHLRKLIGMSAFCSWYQFSKRKKAHQALDEFHKYLKTKTA